MPPFTTPSRWRLASPIDPASVARTLAPAMRWPGLGTEVRERCWRIVAATREFDAWVIAWPEAAGLSFHDHGASSGAIAVVQGDLVETVPHREDSGRLSFVRRVLHPGSVLPLGQGHVHDVSNAGLSTAVSLHVYSPPLTSMTHYDLVEGTRLEARRVQVAPDWDDRPRNSTARTDEEFELSRAG
jgi:hypothetical protein